TNQSVSGATVLRGLVEIARNLCSLQFKCEILRYQQV
ncbi:hypothetical protein PspLS_04505, partial [Pyricularia sp. CBS 133598]